jgi:hypothetical protein
MKWRKLKDDEIIMSGDVISDGDLNVLFEYRFLRSRSHSYFATGSIGNKVSDLMGYHGGIGVWRLDEKVFTSLNSLVRPE